MKKKIISAIIVIVCVIVAAVCLKSFVFTKKETHIKDVSKAEFEEAYNLLATSYLNDNEEAEVYYIDNVGIYYKG